MFETIVTNNEINFNELEKKIYKFVCLLGCNLIKEIIEKYDVKLQEERDKSTFRHRGLKTDSIKTVMGVVEYKKTIYEYKENDKKKYKFLLDENLKLSEFGKISENLVEEYMKEIKQSLKASKKALIRLNNCESNEYYRNVHIDSQSPIYQAIRQMPISELEYII